MSAFERTLKQHLVSYRIVQEHVCGTTTAKQSPSAQTFCSHRSHAPHLRLASSRFLLRGHAVADRTYHARVFVCDQCMRGVRAQTPRSRFPRDCRTPRTGANGTHVLSFFPLTIGYCFAMVYVLHCVTPPYPKFSQIQNSLRLVTESVIWWPTSANLRPKTTPTPQPHHNQTTLHLRMQCGVRVSHNIILHYTDIQKCSVLWLWCRCGVSCLWTKVGTCGPPQCQLFVRVNRTYSAVELYRREKTPRRRALTCRRRHKRPSDR